MIRSSRAQVPESRSRNLFQAALLGLGFPVLHLNSFISKGSRVHVGYWCFETLHSSTLGTRLFAKLRPGALGWIEGNSCLTFTPPQLHGHDLMAMPIVLLAGGPPNGGEPDHRRLGNGITEPFNNSVLPAADMEQGGR